MIAIVDYGMGNLASVQKALTYLKAPSVITSDIELIKCADALILPGVGAFIPAMKALNKSGLGEAVKEFAASGKPVMGICLGMQLLLDSSEEGGETTDGLGLIAGKVVKFPADETVDEGLKVPQMGWNSLVDVKSKYLRESDYVYFVHSYYCDAADVNDVAAYAEYGIKYPCSLQKNNIFATQFHPEKSGEAGLQILKRFVDSI
ncbi:MAG: imidazole glycerol phosphate synthase subunit HisH [Clostridia bacterium]|nr:imidazole glycerol phosphate synthase subunit HisH [Clostridia bacterium]